MATCEPWRRAEKVTKGHMHELLYVSHLSLNSLNQKYSPAAASCCPYKNTDGTIVLNVGAVKHTANTNFKGKLNIKQSVRWHAQLSYNRSSIRSSNWTTVLVPGYKRWGRMDLLSDSAAVGGDMPCSAGCYWTFLPSYPAKQATSKLERGL